MGWLNNSVSLITGGGSGLGRALVERFIAEGAQVGVLERDSGKAQQLEQDFGERIRVTVGDVTSWDDNRSAVAATVEAFGKLDTFIGNAGVFDYFQALADTPGEKLGAAFDELFSVNVKGYLLGAKAARDYGVRAPLMEAGFTKADVRALARRWDIPVWDRPAMACLSSRFPYGTPITAEQLRMVDRAEAFLRDEGFAQLRVRHHTDLARIELPGPDLDRLLADPALCRRLNAQLAAIGYDRVTADLRGFRSGSMNEVLMPAAADPNAVPDRIAQLLGALPDAAAAVRREQMLVIEVGPRTGALLAQTPQRLALVEALEALGLRYIALDLAPTS